MAKSAIVELGMGADQRLQQVKRIIADAGHVAGHQARFDADSDVPQSNYPEMWMRPRRDARRDNTAVCIVCNGFAPDAKAAAAAVAPKIEICMELGQVSNRMSISPAPRRFVPQAPGPRSHA